MMNAQEHLTAAVQRNDCDWLWHYHRCMTADDKEAFDQWLVETNDPLAHQPGTQAWRFEMKVNQARKAQ